MPVILESTDLFTTTPTKVDPKYFDKELTGNGKGRGRLSSSLHPHGHIAANEVPMELLSTKHRQHNGGITKTYIPFAPLLDDAINTPRTILHFPLPDTANMFHVTEDVPDADTQVWLNLRTEGLVLTEDKTGDKADTTLTVLYRLEAYLIKKDTQPTVATYNSFSDAQLLTTRTFGPTDDVISFVKDALYDAKLTKFNPNWMQLEEWLTNFNVYDGICEQAEIWSGPQMIELMNTYLDDLFSNQRTVNVDELNALAQQIRYLENYPISLETYHAIHTHMEQVIPDATIVETLAKQNLNMLMSHSLEELNKVRSHLPVVTDNGASASLPQWISAQQRQAITTDEPLVLVQAGAGVGKSTVILERIDYMIKSGINPADITVLSFTNAAADNIREKNPGINSMTTALMIHEIYSLNYPNQELSSIDTIINSLDIYYPMNDIAIVFKRRLIELQKKTAFPGATTALNSFIEHHQSEIIDILNTIRQTCLELEIILAYQQIETMIEPKHVTSKYLIVDEVQDNSIFEFIYTLKYVAKHQENLYIVGDASQTLYEFRASNPKALNALEESKIFATFSLTTNYRSNQAILDFANRSLAKIEANQYAKILLRANSLAKITPKDFTQRVIMDYRMMHRPATDFKLYLPAYLKNVLRPWINECLERGEKVAFLAYDRRTVTIMQNTLQEMYPDKEVISLVSDRLYASTIFSDFIKKYWNQVRQVPDLGQAPYAITQGILNNMESLVRDVSRSEDKIKKLLSKWWFDSRDIIASWVLLNRAGQLTDDDFFERLKRNVLDFEVKENSIKQTLLNQRNNERKEKNLNSNAPLIVSTIHGVKGLEFDNVAVMYSASNTMDEATKRMYYVALTRAINTEYILAYGSVVAPKIVADYELVMADLVNAQRIEKLQSQGFDVEHMEEREIQDALELLNEQAKAALEAGDTQTAIDLTIPDIEFSTTGEELTPEDLAGIAASLNK